MRRIDRQSGMTLIEVLIVLATILILVGAVITVGKTLQQRAAVDLTKSLLEVLDTALQQYYDDFGKFPFIADLTFNESRLEDVDVLNGQVSPPDDLREIRNVKGTLITYSTASSAALFYYLDRNPDSRKIAAAVSNVLITNKGYSGSPVTLTFNPLPPQTIDLPRYIDSWGTSLRYVYAAGAAFPVLTSAGPDKVFDAPYDQDNITNQ